MQTEITGILERITYFNEENGYMIARLKVKGRSDLVTIVGNLHEMNPGEILLLQGEWINHPQYGEQFKVISYQTKVPASVHGIEKYLGSGLIKGIGPVYAKRIVKVFGDKTLDVIEEDVNLLLEVEGIGKKRIEMIGKAWQEQKEIRQVMIFLQSHGISSTFASKIFKQYGNEAISTVKENPYRLAHDIFGIGFLTADRIAEKLGFAKDSDLRAQAGILFVLHQLSEDGHVFYPYTALLEEAQKILEIPIEIIERALNIIASEQRVVIEELKTENDSRAVYLAKFHYSETQAASRLKALLVYSKKVREIDPVKAIDWVQNKLSLELAEKQKEAVISALNNKVMVVTGGPGVGKTTIIKAILELYSALKVNVLLAAPTGRAAKRMSETTGMEAKTIHRLLEFSPGEGGFKKNEEEPLECDLLIIDEMSMVDIILFHHLLKAVPLHSTLIMVGDIHQLPSVGAGNVLKDVIESGVVPVVELNQIFRQALQSSIIVNAHKINQGIMPELKRNQENLDDFYFIEQDLPEAAIDTIVKLIKERIPKTFGFDPIREIQVLTPMQKGTLGGANLNQVLQNALNSSQVGINRGGRRFLVGDKVMQIKNDYDREVYNGDWGRILSIDSEMQEVKVDFDGRVVAYDYAELDELVLAYAVSVHKSQGSEYPAVIIPLHTQHYVMLQRNLLYTGVTRGKKLVVVIGSKKAFWIAVKNDQTQKRYSWLKERLKF
jgi:exodeoxyribonuclease V alpha subunit